MMKLINGERQVEVGQLDRRVQKRSVWQSNNDYIIDRVKVEWVIAAPNGGMLKI